MSDSRPSTAGDFPAYPGERLGLPESGPGSIAGWGRRIVALFVDWVASTLVAALVFGYQWFGETAGQQGWVGATPLLVFWLEASFLTALLGGSFGQLVMRVVVVRVDGRQVTLLQALLRTLLILLVIPPLVFNRDQRGLHDLATKTVTLRR
ncbi:MAG TPA: RDD family protein [Nocardioidaceae bacterium]